MKKLVSVLLVLTLALSLFTVAAGAADTDKPAITKAVIISKTEVRFTTNEDIKVSTSGADAFALFFAKEQTDGDVTKDVIEFTTRFGGKTEPVNPDAEGFSSTFICKFSSNVITKYENMVNNGYTVYFGMNGQLHPLGLGDTGNSTILRAEDRDRNGFDRTKTIGDDHATHDIHAVSLEPFAPNTISTVKLINDSSLVIAFARPLVNFQGGVLLGVLNTQKSAFYYDDTTEADSHVSLTVALQEDGTLLCSFDNLA